MIKRRYLTDTKKSIDLENGLTNEQVRLRIKNGQINKVSSSNTKTVSKIIKANLFTLFNLINLILAIMLILVKSYKNTVFIIVALINLIIGIINEIRAKIIIDKLSLLTNNKILVMRDGHKVAIDMDKIVLDDVIILDSGCQVVVDSVILDGEVEVNQSFITGEEEAIYKKKGEVLLSGSFIISGNCKSQAIRVGDDSYTSKISTDVKFIKKVNSEILRTFNKIIKIITFIIIPFGLFTFFKHLIFLKIDLQSTVVATVAAIDGMIPNGLILLTSTIMAVSVIKLYKYKVLVQELYCLETLARVDTICLDKTGTLTEGKMEVIDVIPYNDYQKNDIGVVISNIMNYVKDNNATSKALCREFNGNCSWKGVKKIPFSSKYKYSGATFEKHGTYLIGACENLLKSQYNDVKDLIDEYATNYRVVVVVHIDGIAEPFLGEIPEKVDIMGFVLLQDKIRKNSKKIINYFENEGIDIKIISGDSIKTLENIAKRLNIKNINAIDMTNIKKSEIINIVKKYNIFGRVSPNQKKEIIMALHSLNHKVAMTGDGVNDVLALKEADCSITLASGSDAAKNVSQLVLLSSNFDSLPKVLLEGRKAINNIENAASLFLSKTIYSIVLVIIFLFLPYAYPFSSLQMSLISGITIGIPSFYL